MPVKKHDKLISKKVSDLIPYVNNSRVHSEEQVIQICSSIKEFGFTNPVLIDEESGVIAGHGRIMAAKKLGMKTVPCLVLAGLSEAQKKAYVIADNAIALKSEWNMDLLAVEVADLGDMDFDLDVLGFSDEELAELSLDGDEIAPPDMASGDKDNLRQCTFTLTESQYEGVMAAIKAAIAQGEFVDTGNGNKNGNGLARVCEAFNGQG